MTTPIRLPFVQVDVFGLGSFLGNPVAVVFLTAADAADLLDTKGMQRIARWTNLSETTFVLPASTPEASYRLRIFTPRQELPFAGHPSVGTAHAVIEAGLAKPDPQGRLIQECAAGLLPLRVESEPAARQILVRLPEPRETALSATAQHRLQTALGVDITPAAAVDVGPVWVVAGLDSGRAVRALQPDLDALAALSVELGAVGMSVFGFDESGEAGLVVRSFVPADGIPEDPVCGSGNGAIGAYLQARGQFPGAAYTASQGRECGRDGRVRVELDPEGRVWIGGGARTLVQGQLTLDAA
ncbi:MAG: PhzF family phenazine biosynthesis protein [Aquimonas sp.]|nr:PhzF family phenazine biosynthesis protein [Aquimonas sp.]